MTDKITSIANLCADRIADRIEMHQLTKKPILKSDIAEDVARVLRELGIETTPRAPHSYGQAIGGGGGSGGEMMAYISGVGYCGGGGSGGGGGVPGAIGGYASNASPSIVAERIEYDPVQDCVKTTPITADQFYNSDEEAEYWRQLNSIMTANELKRYRALLKPRNE